MDVSAFAWTDALGALAMTLSIASFMPQAWKIIRSRDTSALSATMYAITVAGFGCWFAYAIATMDWPLIASNAICGAVALFILCMKLLPRRKVEQVAETLGVPPEEPAAGEARGT